MCSLKLIQGDDSGTALIQACRHGHVETATVLLDHGAHVDYRDEVKDYLNSTLTTSVIHTE